MVPRFAISVRFAMRSPSPSMLLTFTSAATFRLLTIASSAMCPSRNRASSCGPNADVARSALDAARLEAHWSAFLDCEFYGDHARRMVGLARTGKRTLFDDVIESIRSVGDRNSNHRLVLTLED